LKNGLQRNNYRFSYIFKEKKEQVTKDLFNQMTRVFAFSLESSSFIANNYPSLDKKKRGAVILLLQENAGSKSSFWK